MEKEEDLKRLKYNMEKAKKKKRKLLRKKDYKPKESVKHKN